MPAFVARWSKEHREVLFRETIDRERPVVQVLRAARAGELEGMEPRDQAELGAMRESYARQLVRDERERRQDTSTIAAAPDQIARELAAQLLKRAQLEVRRITSTSRKPMDTGASVAVLKVIREAQAILESRTKGSGQAAKAGAADTTAPAAPASFAARIAAQRKTEAGNANAHGNVGEASDASRSDTTSAQTNGSDAGPVRLRVAEPERQAPAGPAV